MSPGQDGSAACPFAKGRAGSAGASEEQISVVQGATGCWDCHRVLVSGALKVNFSGLRPVLGHDDGIHLLRKDFAIQCLVIALMTH